MATSTAGTFLTGAFDYVRSVSTAGVAGLGGARAKERKELEISEHDFEEFSSLFQLNDRLGSELQDDFTADDLKKYELNAPKVIVVGLTSAGKSSLLERVIGHRVFPVKDTVCTRRPFAVHLRNDPNAEHTTLRFSSTAGTGNGSGSAPSRAPIPSTAAPGGPASPSMEGGESKERHDYRGEGEPIGQPTGPTYTLPAQIEAVRAQIEHEQKSDIEDVVFSSREIHAEVRSRSNETFTFTDLPGIFLVSERKIGSDYAKSRVENEKLKTMTMEITKKYIAQPNTIVLVVISSTDWIHGMNNDSLISYLAEWIEEVRKDRDIPVYGVITKLDTQEGLSANSPIKKVLTGTLGKDHILNGLRVRKWIPVVSSPAILNEQDKQKAQAMEIDAIHRCLRGVVPAAQLATMPVGRSALLKQLKQSLLAAIGDTHGDMRRQLDTFMGDIDKKLERLPQPASLSEKRRIFDGKLKILETCLNDAVGARGNSNLGEGPSGRSARMQLMVDAPAAFEQSLNKTSLRGNLVEEVRQILNQAALEQGGSFDSDASFNYMSVKIVEKFTQPCLALVERCATIVRHALRESTTRAFGDYKELEKIVLTQLGVPMIDDPRPTDEMFNVLKMAATAKVHHLLDGFSTMACFHPLWRNFDVLYSQILMKADESKAAPVRTEATLQEILNLPALAKVARDEGELAISLYERENKTSISPANKLRISKHFARVEVMGYIVRMSLISSVYPLVLRDMRDGLFKGVHHGSVHHDHSVSTLLRMKLVFDATMEKRVFECMDPSADDAAARARLVKKRDTLNSLKAEFGTCQAKLRRLQELMAA